MKTKVTSAVPTMNPATAKTALIGIGFPSNV